MKSVMKGKPETRGRTQLQAKWPAIILLVVYAYESCKQLSLFTWTLDRL